MNKETQSIIRNLQNVLSGEPWYGKSVYTTLEKVDISKVYTRPGNTEHSMIELLYHMITWAEFTLKQIEKADKKEILKIQSQDWITIDPSMHTWKKGLTKLKAIHKKIVQLLDKKEDKWLKEKVSLRKFNYRFMLNGFIQHNIYHLGQIAYVNKLLAPIP